MSAPVAARLLRIGLREGDAVRAGEPVATLLPAMPAMVDERSEREARARWQAAGANVAAAQARRERAGIALDGARLELQRQERLALEGFVSAARLESAALAVVSARREVEAARAGEQAAAYERAQAAAVLLPARSAQTGVPLVLTAPTDGMVLRVAQASESKLPAGTPLLEIGDPRQMEVVAELLTTDAIQAPPGRRAVIEGWGGPAFAAGCGWSSPAPSPRSRRPASRSSACGWCWTCGTRRRPGPRSATATG